MTLTIAVLLVVSIAVLCVVLIRLLSIVVLSVVRVVGVAQQQNKHVQELTFTPSFPIIDNKSRSSTETSMKLEAQEEAIL